MTKQGVMDFQCEVCFEQRTDRLPLPRLSTLNGDVIRPADCHHPICRDCMASFVVARVEEQRVFGIRCPMPDCANELQEQDVQSLVRCGALPKAVGQRFAELRKKDYTARANSFSEMMEVLPTAAEFSLLKRLWSMARRCPRCHVILEKSQGCDSFGCICGHSFNFKKAPRAFGDGIDQFDSVLDVAWELGIPPREAVEKVRDLCAKGVKKYTLVLKLARQRNIPISLAEVHALAANGHQPAIKELRQARMARRHERRQRKTEEVVKAQLSLSPLEARALLEQARADDRAAWERIREARRSASLEVDYHWLSTRPDR